MIGSLAKAQQTTQEWQKEAVRRYPDLGKSDSKLNADFRSKYAALQKSNPAFFNDPKWPILLVERCLEVIPGVSNGSPTPGWLSSSVHSANAATTDTDSAPMPTLFTRDDILRSWENNLPKAKTLDADFYKVQAQRDKFYRELKAGKYGDEAQDEADAANIPILMAAKKYEEAKIVQARRDALRQKRADQKLADDHRKMLSELQQQTAELMMMRTQLQSNTAR